MKSILGAICLLMVFPLEMTGKDPLIGISCGGSRANYAMNSSYFTAVTMAGGVPVMLPMVYSEAEAEALMSHIDGLLMTGGEDVEPSRYGEEVLNPTVYSNALRDTSDFLLIQAARRHQIPILGTCRGEQIVNVCLGGTLYQDIPSQIGDRVTHRGRHWIYIEKDSMLYRLLGRDSVEVNSSHHQAVRHPAPGLKITSRAADSVVESYEGDGIFCIQFHPEVPISAGDGTFLPIYLGFIRDCRDR